jgi:alpha-tubulin suppressor-like RCC1 family protein
MSFFQNVFDFEFRPTLLGADRQYQMSWKLPANTNRSDYMLSGNAGPFNLSNGEILTINYAYDVNFVNYSSMDIDISGTTPEATTAQEIVSTLNSDATFASMFTAVVYPSTTNPQSPNKILIKGLNSRGIFRAYISNSGAEKILQFNKKAPIRELPSYFARYTIAERFNYPTLGPDRVIELDPACPYEAGLISAAGYDPAAPKEDWELLQGQNEAYWTYNRTYADSVLVSEIKYQSGARPGDLAKKIFYTYSGSDLIGQQDVPYVLQEADILTPPNDPTYLWVAGYNDNGRLGTNDTINYSSPVQTVAGGSNWKMVSGGYEHSAGVKFDGTLWCWGRNADGQLGTNDTTDVSSPVQTIANTENWKSVACGGFHTVAIKEDGTLWSWGNNYNGQLGTNDTNYYSSPVQEITNGTTWKSVTCGYAFTAAIKNDGTLWMWGFNYAGQLGDDSTDRRSSPVQTVAGGNNWFQVACGYSYTAAVKTDGTLHVWGSNYDGQLGTNDTNGYSSPVQTVTGGNNWKAVACGNSHTLALDCDGNIWSFGSNSYGELGDSTTNDKSSPVQIETASSEWAQVFAGGEGSGSIRDDKTLWVWGFNPSGELGTGNTSFYSSPVQTVMNGNNWKSGAFGTFHALLLKN